MSSPIEDIDLEIHTKRYINVKTQFVGYHSYPDAPDEVAFLKNNHRHIFKVEALIEVFHQDRELEFFMVKDILDREIICFIALGDLGSCENIAYNILKGLLNTYGKDRFYSIEVSEDGENSGSIDYSPDN